MPPEPSTADIAAALRSRLMSYGGAAPPGTPNLDMIQMLEQAAQQPQPQTSYTNYDYQPPPPENVRPAQPQGGCVNYGYQSPPVQHNGAWAAQRAGTCQGSTAKAQAHAQAQAQTPPPVWHKASPPVRPPQTQEANGVVPTKSPEDLAAALSDQLMNPGGTPSVELIEALARAAQLPDSDYPHIAPASTPPIVAPALTRVEGQLDPLAGTPPPARKNPHASNGITTDESGSAAKAAIVPGGVCNSDVVAATVVPVAPVAAATTANSCNGPDMQSTLTSAIEFGEDLGQGKTVSTDPYTQGVGNGTELVPEEKDQFKRPIESSQHTAGLQTPAVPGSSLGPVPSLAAPSPFPMSNVQSPLPAGHMDESQVGAVGRTANDSNKTHALPFTHDAYSTGPLANGNTDTTKIRAPSAVNQANYASLVGTAGGRVSHGQNAIMEAKVTPTQVQHEIRVETAASIVSPETTSAGGAATRAPVEMTTQQFSLQAQSSLPGAATINMPGMNGGHASSVEASVPGGPDVGGGRKVLPKLDGTVGTGTAEFNGYPLTARAAAGPAHGMYRYDVSPKDDVEACFRNIRRRIEVELDDGCTVQMYLQMARGR